MKTNLHIPSISALCILAALALAAMPGTASAQVLVANSSNNTITEYTLSGAPVGSGTLVNGLGLDFPVAIAVSGSDIFVLNLGGPISDSSITEYTMAGAPVGSGTLVYSTGFDTPAGIAVSGTHIFVTNSDGDTITEYTTAGAPVGSGTLVSDPGLSIPGDQALDLPTGITVSGQDIFVINEGRGTITEFTTAGAPVGTGTLTVIDGTSEYASNCIAESGSDIFVADYGNNTILEYYANTGAPVVSGPLVSGSGLSGPRAMAVAGADIFVANTYANTITEYTTAGAPVGSGTLVNGSGLSYPLGLVVVPVISDAISLGGGWNWSKTIGYFAGLPPGWIYHEQLGWLYFDTDDISSNIWIWDPASGMGWVWTNLSTYPNMYRASDGAWLWYDEGTTGPCWFYNLTASKWESH